MSVITQNTYGHFIKQSEADEVLLDQLASRFTKKYDKRLADLVVINLQETYLSSITGLDLYQKIPSATFVQNQKDFLEKLKKRLSPFKMNCYYSDELIFGALTSFFCSNQKVGFKGLYQKLHDDEEKTHPNHFKGALSFIIQLPGVNVMVTNVHFSSTDFRLRRAQMDRTVRESMIEYEQVGDYTTPLLFVLAGDMNSRNLVHLELDSAVMQDMVSDYREGFSSCQEEQLNACIDLI